MLKPFATKLDESVLKQLDELARKTQIPKARLCRQAIELLVSYYEQREKRLAGTQDVARIESTLAAARSHGAPAGGSPKTDSKQHF